jgi:hypothetical protein
LTIGTETRARTTNVDKGDNCWVVLKVGQLCAEIIDFYGAFRPRDVSKTALWMRMEQFIAPCDLRKFTWDTMKRNDANCVLVQAQRPESGIANASRVRQYGCFEDLNERSGPIQDTVTDSAEVVAMARP